MVFGLPLAGLSLAGILGYVILNAGSQSIPNRILRYGPLVGLGTVSYTLYLVHVSLYFLVSEVFSRLMGYAPVTYRSALVVSIVSAAVSVSVAWISFRYIESPILKYKDKVTRHVIRSSMNSPLTNTLGKAFS
jgi:peptidoglycan/LPS O-acetylase OafA/YrhL